MPSVEHALHSMNMVPLYTNVGRFRRHDLTYSSPAIPSADDRHHHVIDGDLPSNIPRNRKEPLEETRRLDGDADPWFAPWLLFSHKPITERSFIQPLKFESYGQHARKVW